MDIRIEQECPQCGAPITIAESDRLLSCPYCGVKSFMQSSGAFRYVLPPLSGADASTPLLYAPYLRFKGNVFLVNEAGITYKVMDTTRQGYDLTGLPPSLGIRPQAMQLQRLLPTTSGRYLRLTAKARVILKQAVQVLPRREKHSVQEAVTLAKDMIYIGSRMETISHADRDHFLHRAFIGETVSFVYLPLQLTDTDILDGVTGNRLLTREQAVGVPLRGTPFNPRWQVEFMPTLCPRCGWSLDGEGDCLVMTCGNCDTAWALGQRDLERIGWQMVAGDRGTALYLGFWKISAHIPALDIYSFTDFIERTNQPMVARPEWHERVMSYWIPAFKLRPKIFLRTGRQATLGQWRLDPEDGHVVPNLYPVTLPVSEAKQAIKVILAASTASRKKIFPFLPEVRLQDITATLVFLPFVDKGHDWYQPQTGVAISKNVLRFGRSL
ncbi:MAG TPA: zinc ribbon domain-containing protein [Desulfobulbus sp.]|nr:zinc ribbon domain-containing protein [Desulfobulbus sp.]